MSALRLRSINWEAAVAAAEADPAGPSPSLTELRSLSARYTPDFSRGAARLASAQRQEPFNPLHPLRVALLRSRFGEQTGAVEAVEQLKESLPATPLLEYLRGLFALRSGRADQTRAIAGSLETAFPEFLPAKFLRAEAQVVLASKASAAEKYLMALPSGSAWDALWCDLLAKLILLHPKEGPVLASKYLVKSVGKEAPGRAFVQRVLGWVKATDEELQALVIEEKSGSRAEALALSVLVQRLQDKETQAAISETQRWRMLHPDRPAATRLHTAMLMRRAVELSAGGDHEGALRITEICLRDQPFDATYHQNRAALFTMLRETAPYHDSWAALNRHQYRMMLLGAMDLTMVRHVVQTHRLFARQAAGPLTKVDVSARGVFRFMPAKEAGSRNWITPNQEVIKADSELLRQWICHTQAELVFRHVQMGHDPRRIFLDPSDRDQAVVRSASLAQLSKALPILVPEEGEVLAGLLAERWRTGADTVRSKYAGAGADESENLPEIHPLERLHLETIGFLCVLCRDWRPDFDQLGMAEALLVFLEAEVAFLNPETLFRIEREMGSDTPYALCLASVRLKDVAGVKPGAPVTDEQKHAFFKDWAATLLEKMSWAAYTGGGESQKERVLRAMPYIDRARRYCPSNDKVELSAARLLVLGDFFAESRQALDRFRRLAKPDDQDSQIEAQKISEILRERTKEGQKGEQRRKQPEGEISSENRMARVAELEEELQRTPTLLRVYEELVHELAIGGRFEDAVQWGNRAVARCLSRVDQLGARSLAIEAAGIQLLAAIDQRSAQLYVVGAHEPARAAIESIPDADRKEYALLFLLGRCQLAAGSPNDARSTFARAAESCNRPSHRSVLRSLAEDVDSAYLAIARQRIHAATQAGEEDEAAAQAAAVFSRLQEPAAWIIEFARLFYTAAVERASGTPRALTIHPILISAPWEPDLRAALTDDDDVERALALAELAERVHAPSRTPAQALAERARALKVRLQTRAALARAGQLLAARQFEETLAFLAATPAEVADEPRLQRLRILALLGSHRFSEAEAAAERVAETRSAELKGFLAEFPALLFRQRMAVAHGRLRENKLDGVREILSGAAPVTAQDAAELAYCHAFLQTLEGYRLRKTGKKAESHARFQSALREIDGHLIGAKTGGQRHIVELYERLEKETEDYA